MGIMMYIKEIGRGKDGARSLTRAQAADLFGQLLDGGLQDLEVGAFCLAMRIKGETPQEMAGFLDATHARLSLVPAPVDGKPTIVIPSYNGARKLPALTPLLALLLAREGLPVLIHGTATESTRVYTAHVLAALGIPAQVTVQAIAPGTVQFVPTHVLCAGLQRLLEVRRVVGLRNSSHSVVKLMNPCAGKSLVLSSYTHPEYAVSMAATFELMQSNALLLRGTEGESVADARRMPKMEAFVAGAPTVLQEAQSGTLPAQLALPLTTEANATAAYTREVLDGTKTVPESIAKQVEHILRLVQQL
jgi:anthranilate phosphoribosyltransferase